MKISMLLAWCAVLCVLLTAVRYPARVSKRPACNRLFHKLHIPAGVLALLFGLIHGLLAGSLPVGSITIGSMLLTLNWGSVCFLLMLLLGVSYLLRRQLKRAWLPVHRVLTVLLLAALVVHLTEVGIHLFDKASVPAAPAPTISASAAPTSALTPTPTPPPAESAVEQSDSLPEEDSVPEEVLEETKAEFSGALLADGVYQGSAQGYQSTITVEVTVARGQVTEITVLEQNDTPRFFDYAATIPDTVVETQSLEVDAVTGATYSSAGLLNAIEDALSGAVIEGTLKVNEAMDALPEKGGHGKH